MAECSTPLRERQNFSLNESSISADGSLLQNKSLHKKMDDLIKKVESLEKQLERKTPKATPASRQCAQLLRQTYKSMEENIGWNLTSGFNAPDNIRKTGILIDECKMLADKFDCTTEEFQVAAKTFYRSLHDREIRRQNGKLTAHKMANKRGDRLRRKLKSRKQALTEVNWSERKKEKISTVLKSEYMSSESSCSDESDTEILTVRPLQWESKKLRKYKKKLDQCILESSSVKSLRLRRQRRRNEDRPSDRLVPKNIPAWACRVEGSSLDPEKENEVQNASYQEEEEEDETNRSFNDPYDFGSESDFDFQL